MSLPFRLRDAIAQERLACQDARIHHSQELFALRDEAIEFASRRNRERFARPHGVQLPLAVA